MNTEKLLSVLLLGALFALPVVVTAETAPAATAEPATAATAASATAESTEPMFGDYQAKGFLSDYSKNLDNKER